MTERGIRRDTGKGTGTGTGTGTGIGIGLRTAGRVVDGMGVILE